MTEDTPSLAEMLEKLGIRKKETPRTKRPTLEERFNLWHRMMDEYIPEATKEQRIGLLYEFAEHLKITPMMAYIRQIQEPKKTPIRRVTL